MMRLLPLRCFRSVVLASSGMAMALGSTMSSAQTDDSAARIDRLERQLRAVQSRVFPGGQQDPLFRPPVGAVPPGTANNGPENGASSIGDISSRLDAFEAQQTRLTADVEQIGFRQRQSDEAVARMRAEINERLNRIDPPASTGDAPPTAAAPTQNPVATLTPTPTPRPATATPTPRLNPSATSATPSAGDAAARRARVAALEQPATGDAGEDAYLFGFRLWDTRLYPEAQAQLQRVIERYPNHRRASFAGNLLGRAFLDNDQPTLAVRAFYDNYRNRPRGERAAESVYYMGMALIRLDRQADACRTFGEFDRSYGATAAASLKAQVARGRTEAGC